MEIRDNIVVLDCGSQYTQLIARRIRELAVHSEILPWDVDLESLRARRPRGIVVSGGPRSVTEPEAPSVRPELLDGSLPVLGICYGMQALAHGLGGRVERAGTAEYGRARLRRSGASSVLLRDLEEEFSVWMSHWDQVVALPSGARATATSENGAVAAFEWPERNVWALQFHPEVAHTERGKEILGRFLFDVCGCEPSWNLADWIDRTVGEIRERVGEDRVICGLSGGVDSTVAAVLTARAVGDRLNCVFVDNGLLRKDEARQVREAYGALDLRVRFADAGEEFLSVLEGVEDPERKRKAIGETFVRVFEREARSLGGARWLLQGTLYPDVIESGFRGKGAAVIKTHHNVGGLPERMDMAVLEPLKDLFKDEVRAIGRLLGVPETILGRHPFPGPGLAVRCLGAVTRERLALLREADAILQEEIRAAGLYGALWQAFCVLLPAKSVGVMGDVRTYAEAVAIRAVESLDGMTADWARLPHELIDRIARRICNGVPGINRVVLDVTSKPPSTIEWE